MARKGGELVELKAAATFRHEYGSGTSSNTAQSAPLPNPSHGMEYASYCEGVAAQLAGNSNIPTASNASHRQIAAHALGRLDASVSLRCGAKTGGTILMTKEALTEALDSLFALRP
jgi:hypothetical protein